MSEETLFIETHPDFPFVKIGASSCFGRVFADGDPGEWRIEIDGAIHPFPFSTRSKAFAETADLLFGEWCPANVISNQIEVAIQSGDTRLALRLSEGMGRYYGRREAEREFARAVSRSDGALELYRQRA